MKRNQISLVHCFKELCHEIVHPSIWCTLPVGLLRSVPYLWDYSAVYPTYGTTRPCTLPVGLLRGVPYLWDYSAVYPTCGLLRGVSYLWDYTAVAPTCGTTPRCPGNA